MKKDGDPNLFLQIVDLWYCVTLLLSCFLIQPIHFFTFVYYFHVYLF